ncbi:MAG: protein kinase, partial [Pirellulales bacterium]|nr:protein kinase [Pirellulales bacterium]
MNPTEQACDMQRIDDYLDERLSRSELAEFEKHLTHCDSCRNKLQHRAAEPEMWRDAVELLGHHGEASRGQPVDDGEGRHRRRVLSVLDLLSPTDDPEMLGRIGDYEISGVVGVGGMGAVLKGFDRSLRRVVAVKVMAPHLADNGSARTRFQREARAAAAITHDNVIDTYGVSEANGLPYLVMPFARGPSLQKRIDDSGPLTAIEVIRIGRQIASGLAAAHEQGLVHRDIKPANILLNEGIERLWITDFGVARAIDDASMTQTGLIAGTPQYMSPEQARGEFVDHRSDLFSLGSILYTACTGRPPFRAEAAYGILRRITDTDPRPIREIKPDVPQWLCRVIDRLMAKHPADRFQNAEEVAELLEGCLAHLQQPTRVELPPCVTLPKQTDETKRTDETVLPPGERQKRQSAGADQTRQFRFLRTGIRIMVSLLLLAGMGLVAFQMTGPVDITGKWTGENWKNVSLSSVEEASGWYTGSFTDAQGRRGALQLEWSHLQRRYNGRWKVGGEQSGSITLRAGDGGAVRGAVSVDPDSQVASNMPRLREFSWLRSTAETAAAAQLPSRQVLTGPATSIQAPISGRIIRLGDGIFENARVKKDDLIAEISSSGTESLARIEDQLAVSEQQVEAAQAVLQANIRSLDAAKITVTSFESQLRAYEQVKLQVVAAAEAAVASMKNKVEAERTQLAEYEAALAQTLTDFERQKVLHDQEIVSDLEFQTAKQKVREAETKVEKTKAYVRSAENDVLEKQGDQKAKGAKAQVDVESATALLNKAKVEVAKAEA